MDVMSTITIKPKNKSQEATIKKVLKALDVPFEKSASSYDPELVEKIKEAEKSIEQGNFTEIKGKEELTDFLNSL